MNTAQLITSLLEEHQPANVVIIGSPGSGKTITANSISTNSGRHNPIIIEAQAERQLPPHCLSGAAAIIILRITNVETANMLSEYTGGRVSPVEIMNLSHLVGYFVVPNSDPVKLDIRQLLPV